MSIILVTYHTEPLLFDRPTAYLDRTQRRDRMRHGPDHLLFRFLERAVDQSLEVIEYLDERVDAVQNLVIEDRVQETLQEIFRINARRSTLHKIFGPQREVLNRLARDPYSPIRDVTESTFATSTITWSGCMTFPRASAT